MGVVSGIVLYLVIWFMTFFVALPIRLKTQGDVGDVVPGTHAGAPAEHNLRKKAIITSIIACILWAIVAAIIFLELLTVRDFDWFGRLD